MKHCSVLYRDLSGIHSVDVTKFTPMTWKDDNRWYWRDMPTIMDEGLWYPLLYYKVTLDWWNGPFAEIKSVYPSWDHINPPIVNDDGMIWAVKMGTNRLTALKFMSYTSVDAICFPNSNELIKVGLYLRDENPWKKLTDARAI
jgi:hypothetical protein